MVMRRLLSVLAAALLLVAAPVAHAAGRDDRERKPYDCNPQKECLARAAGLKGAAAEAAKRDCSRMPTSGTCYGAPVDTPADRSERSKKK
jgi:hypothetical protein